MAAPFGAVFGTHKVIVPNNFGFVYCFFNYLCFFTQKANKNRPNKGYSPCPVGAMVLFVQLFMNI